MKRLLLVLALASSAAYADWTPLMDGGGIRYSVDTSAQRVVDGKSRLWVLMDYSAAVDGVRSERWQVEFDCAAERARTLAGAKFSGPAASGSVLMQSDAPGVWKEPAPGTAHRQLMVLACPRS